MRQKALPREELQVCARLRQARERLGKTQAECARQIHVERTTFTNYEHQRTPVRFEIALRFCRQFVVSEEWLATGRFDACYAVAKKEIGATHGLDSVFFRQCVDLLNEPEARHIPPGTLYSEAYNSVLKPRYQELVHKSFYYPRILFAESDNENLALNLLDAINDRFIQMLSNEAKRRKLKPSSAWRVYVRCVFEVSDLIFRKLMQFPSAKLEWLRTIVSDPDSTLEFLDAISERPQQPSIPVKRSDLVKVK